MNNISKKFKQSYHSTVRVEDMVCPYCGYKHEELALSFDLTPDGETLESKCYSCHQLFHYQIELAFTTKKFKMHECCAV